MTNNREIIENTLEEVYQAVVLNKEEALIVSEFVSFLNTININTFFTKESVDTILGEMYSDTTKQETIMDLINAIIVKLSINGLDLDSFIPLITKSVNKFVTSKEIGTDLMKQLTPDKNSLDGIVINICFILRLYGVNVLLNFSELIPKGEKNV